ncbi:MAG: EpsG family protein [Ruminiclostridium sp.]|nr:EpsG family protein [Ruminiclostridium sp.]
MEIYLILMAVVVLLGIPLIEYKPTLMKKCIYITVVFAFMLYITFFRYGLGNDYYSYIYIMRQVDSASFLEIFSLGYETGFIILTKLITIFTTNTDILFMIYGLVILLPTAYAIFRYSENLWMSTMLFISLTFFYCSLNFIRQSIAFAIILLAYRHFKEGNHFRVMLFIFLASLFHSTVIVLIPIYLLAVAIRVTKLSVAIYGLFFAIIYFFSWQILDIAIVILPQYKNYINLDFIQNGFNPVYIILPTIVMLLALAAHFTGYGKAYPKESSIFTSFAMYNFFIWLISTKHFVLERFSMYVYIMMIFFLPSIATYYRKRLQIYLHERKAQKAYAEGKKIKRLRFDITVDEYIRNKRKSNVEATAEEDIVTEEVEIDEKEQQRLDIIKDIIGEDADKLKSAINEDSSDREVIPDEKDKKYKSDERYLPENYKYRQKKSDNKLISIIKHPAVAYSVFMMVAMVSCLWYNYFGLTVTSSGFHGAVPYRSNLPFYMEMTTNSESEKLDNKADWLRKEKNIISYFYKMMKCEDYTIFISSKGDTFSGLNDGAKSAFSHLGFTNLANIKRGENFSAIISGGEIVYMSSSKSPLYYKDTVNGYKVTMKSESNLSSIVIGAKDFSLNEQGINIVVLDSKNNKVIDKVRFKTYYVMLSASR